MCSAYGGFVPKFAQVAAPLNVRTEKDQPFGLELNIAELDAFRDSRND